LSDTYRLRQIDIDLPHAFKCRDYQKEFFVNMSQGKKRAVLVWHRRAGKEKVCWNFMIKEAAKKVGIYYYFFPHFAQGRKILWDGVDKEGFRTLHHIPKDFIDGDINNTEMKIRLRNGSLIQVIGTNNMDTVVGTNPIGCVFSEYSLQDPLGWEFVRPILRENGGWAVFNFTPRGQNHAKVLFDMASKNKDWFCQKLTIEDTKAVSVAAIDEDRREGMSEDMVQQEYYCSFTMGVEGSYYSKYMQRARDEDRIGFVPHDPLLKVSTAWDIGYSDSTSIVFYQIKGQEIRIIDHYENSGEGFAHYADVLKKKPYTYGDHFGPHDINSHSMSTGLSVREVAATIGINFIPLNTLKLKVDDGIEAFRGIFHRIWIDEKQCARLIKCLENYRKEFDHKLQSYKTRPLHDWTSHTADSCRYMAIAIKQGVDSARSGPSDDDVDRWMNQYQPRFS
jgi:phage terminase large subunit